MHFKLIISFIDPLKTDKVIKYARDAGAKGVTILSQARGEGIDTKKTFLGLSVARHTDVVLFIVEEHLARNILETIAKVAKFDKEDSTGMALQIDVEDTVGLSHQIQELNKTIKEKI